MMSITASRWLAAAVAIALYLAMCRWIACRERRRARAAEAAAAALAADGDAGAQRVTVAFATQTGTAERLAWASAEMLSKAGLPARVDALAALDADALAQSRRTLFVCSTYGEGDAPDAAAVFARDMLARPIALSEHRHGLLILGDRRYSNFCGFGRELERWLLASGSQPLFDTVEVDNLDEEALQRWQRALRAMAGGEPVDGGAGGESESIEKSADGSAWSAMAVPQRSRWMLQRRQLLNPGSAGRPSYHLSLTPQGPMPDWQAGDLVRIWPPGEPERSRDYSIASVPQDGTLDLLVRHEQRGDGSDGIASSWLCQALQAGDPVELALVPNASFRAGDCHHRKLLLIGNGTGMAGLRSHLHARAHHRQAHGSVAPAWLVFGERNARCDDYYADEIATWLDDGVLGRVDKVFSRDQPERLHVQDRLRAEADTVRRWIDDGACVMICGSLQGMAQGVEQALREIIGEAALDSLRALRRYRRDVY